MENNLLPQIHSLLNSLIEEKHRIQSEILTLNKSIESRDSQINSLVALVSELNTTSKIRADQASLATKLNQPQPSVNYSSHNSECRKEKLRKCQQVLKRHRQSLVKMAQSIQDELDVFQVCFLADIETFQSNVPKRQIKGNVFAEVIHEGIEDSEDSGDSVDRDKAQDGLQVVKTVKGLGVESEGNGEGKGVNKGIGEQVLIRHQGDEEGDEGKDEKNNEIEIGRIQFAGIQKKSKRGKRK